MLDEEIKKNIIKCSRCALCVQNCPIYEITKDELIIQKGFFNRKAVNFGQVLNDQFICLLFVHFITSVNYHFFYKMNCITNPTIAHITNAKTSPIKLPLI